MWNGSGESGPTQGAGGVDIARPGDVWDGGGWPTLESKPASLDTDRDGMPDDWEKEHQLDPNNPEDRNADQDGDGYTNLEEHLNSLAAVTQ
jgi:hypothetical protein